MLLRIHTNVFLDFLSSHLYVLSYLSKPPPPQRARAATYNNCNRSESELEIAPALRSKQLLKCEIDLLKQFFILKSDHSRKNSFWSIYVSRVNYTFHTFVFGLNSFSLIIM